MTDFERLEISLILHEILSAHHCVLWSLVAERWCIWVEWTINLKYLHDVDAPVLGRDYYLFVCTRSLIFQSLLRLRPRISPV
jgi:hypothetical protein